MIKPHLDQLISQEKRQNTQSHRHRHLRLDQRDAVKIAITHALNLTRKHVQNSLALRHGTRSFTV